MDDATRAFLAEAGWAKAAATPLAGDASARRYLRLRREDGMRAVLMLAPPDGSTQRFVTLCMYLRGLGLSAPAVMADDAPSGRLLLEDLGDDIVAVRSRRYPREEAALYEAAVDTLVALQADPPPAWLDRPNPGSLATLIEPAVTWYRNAGHAEPGPTEAISGALAGPLASVFKLSNPVLVHRDFHAENLLWLSDRPGPSRIGLLDFQDAFAGPPVYDLVSLIEDARRDLAAGLPEALRTRYAARAGLPRADLDTAAAILAAQRNLRILGVFARLCGIL